MYETKFMKRVLELSQQGMQTGHGGPFGCVVVKDGIIVGEAHNEVLSSNDPTAHAELLAVRRASAKLKTFNLSGCELYTNGAPCCMCMSSMLWARVDRAYYVLSMYDSRAIGLGDTVGSIEIGKSADLIVLDRNVLETPASDLADTKVLTTYFEGRVVYERA